MATSFEDSLQYLEKIGFYEVALPFLLVFTLVFAILQKVQIFGPSGRKFNAIIALVMAFFVVRNKAVVEVMSQFLPQVSLIALVIVMVLLLMGILLSKQHAGFTGVLGGVGMILALAAVALAFINSTGSLGIQLPRYLIPSNEDLRLLVGIGIFFAFVMWVTAEPSNENGFFSKIKELVKELPGQFGGSS